MPTTKEPSRFRYWVQEQWFLNCEEHATYGLPKLTFKQYVNQHWAWLRRTWRSL